MVTVVKGEYDKQRREELASFLRSRRERVTPGEVGLAPGSRRRTPGLRREEVAQLAGVGVTWYTWLEQGRPINASVQVLDAVARVLRLGSAERWHLYRLADVPGVPTAVAPAPLPVDVPLVLDALEPSPACIYSGKYDLLACNEAYAALFPALAGASGHERNALWQIFTVSPALGPICNWELVPHMVAVARAHYARHVGDPEWIEWVDRLSRVSSEFAQLWATHQVDEVLPTIKTFRCFDLGLVDTRTASFAVSGVPDARMIVYLPLTTADAAKLAAMRGYFQTARANGRSPEASVSVAESR